MVWGILILQYYKCLFNYHDAITSPILLIASQCVLVSKAVADRPIGQVSARSLFFKISFYKSKYHLWENFGSGKFGEL